MREQLFSLSLISYTPSLVTIFYEGSCRSDGTQLQSQHLVYLLEEVSGKSLELNRIHRQSLKLAEA